MSEAHLESLPNVKFRPQGGRVLVMKLTPEEKSAGGIILPQSVRDEDRRKAREGIVLRTGPGEYWNDNTAQRKEPAVKRGDHVYWEEYVGGESLKGADFSFEYKGAKVELCVIHGSEIIAVGAP
jgi:chaperonin GroES